MKQTVCITLLFSMLLCLFSGCAASGAGAATPQQTTPPPATTAPQQTTTPPTTEPQETTVPPTTAPQETVNMEGLSQYPEVPGMINTPYEYPIVPGTPEWAEHSKPELVKLCKVPDDLVIKLTTPALLETSIGYPYIVDCIAHNNPELAFDRMVKNINTLRELVTRSDLEEVLKTFDLEKTILGQSNMKAFGEIGLKYLEKWLGRRAVIASYSITEPYTYPVTPVSPEWATMTQDEKFAACQVPEDVLKNLTPNALVVTLANYPLFADAADQNSISNILKASNIYEEVAARCKVSVYAVHGYDFKFDNVADYAKDYYSQVLNVYVNDLITKVGILLSPLG